MTTYKNYSELAINEFEEGIVGFGKYKGKLFSHIMEFHKEYIDWLVSSALKKEFEVNILPKNWEDYRENFMVRIIQDAYGNDRAVIFEPRWIYDDIYRTSSVFEKYIQNMLNKVPVDTSGSNDFSYN